MNWIKFLPANASLIFLCVAMLAGCAQTKPALNETVKPSIGATSGDYALVWSDEFDYAGLPDNSKWNFETAGNASGWGNHEKEYYTDQRLANAEVKDGVLHIRARKEDLNGFQYTSARLTTKLKGDWLYGRVEVRAKLPEGRGMWPAIWMMPTDGSYGAWPGSGEIDIMENVGFDPCTIVGSAHTRKYNHVQHTQKNATVKIDGCYAGFHNYILEWDPEEYRLLVDDRVYFTYKNEHAGKDSWPFDQRFFLILNVAVGGDWGGQHGIDDSVFPQEMQVDYVRVYQKVQKD